MFNSPIIDVIITLCFIYFLLGLIVSAAKEAISTIQKWRSDLLREAIKHYLDKEWETVVYPKIEKSPFVAMLQNSIPDKNNKVNNSFPSYIHATQFYQALLSTLQDESGEKLTLDKIREKLQGQSVEDWLRKNYPEVDPNVIPQDIQDKYKNKLLEGKIVPFVGQTRTMLLTMLDQAEGNLDKFQKNIEKSFDESMERVSGWYKRKTRTALFIISIIITVVLNVDSINIVSSLWNDPARAAKAADAAIAASENIKYDSTGKRYTFKSYTAPDGQVTQFVMGSNANASDSLKNELKKLDANYREAAQAAQTIESLGVPMGWSDATLLYCGDKGLKEYTFSSGWKTPEKAVGKRVGTYSWTDNVRLWLFRVFGWFITAMAISMGAPFWFDLFNKVVNLRGSGSKPKKATDKDK